MSRTILLTSFLCGACARLPAPGGLPEGLTARTFVQKDTGGEYTLAREVRWEKKRLASRTQLRSGGTGGALLEKTFALSRVGTVKVKGGRAPAVRPEVSQHTVWLEGKEYFSQLKLIPTRRKLQVIMRSPEAKWNGQKEVNVPRSRVFCFFSQLPECLSASGLLAKVAASGHQREGFMLVWDSYPYHQEHFNGLAASPFAPAVVYHEGSRKGLWQAAVEVAGQHLALHFNGEGGFARMFWVTQGLTVIPPAEAE